MTSIDTLNWLLKLAGIVLPALGLLLLILGLRGRRVGDAPHCRKCRYNLTGVRSTRCPECGHDLTAPKATRLGQRQRRKAPLALGALLLVIALTGWSGEAYRRAKKIDPYNLYPYALLLKETRAGGRASLDEIERRYSLAELSDNQIHQFIQVVLDLHVSDNRNSQLYPWLGLFHQLLLNGDVSASEEQRFLNQVPRINWSLRTRIRAGDPLPFGASLEMLTYQGSSASALVHLEVARLGEHDLSIGDVITLSEVEPHPINNYPISGISMVSKDLRVDPLTVAVALPPGKYELDYKGSIAITVKDSTSPLPFARKVPTYSGAADVPFHFHQTIEIVPLDVPLTHFLDRPDLKDELQQLIQVGPFYWTHTRRTGEPLRCGILDITLGSEASNEAMPIDVAFELLITEGSEEYSLLTVSCRAGQTRYLTPYLQLPPFVEDSMTVILRASHDAAARSYDVYELWNGELIFEEVSVLKR